MRLCFQVYFLAVFLVITVNGAKSSKTCAKPYDKMMVCNLMCNLLQDSGANDAIKMLQAKLENLIAIVNKPSPGKRLSLCRISTQWRRFYKPHEARLAIISKPFARADLNLSVLFSVFCVSLSKRACYCLKCYTFLDINSSWRIIRSFISFTALPASSCKEQYEKHGWVHGCM